MSGWSALSEMFLADGDAGDAVQARDKTNSGAVGHLNRAARSDGDLGSDYIFVPIALAGGYVSGERKVRQRGHRDVLGSADS